MTMTPDEVRSIWKRVQENRARLEACEGPHAFVETTQTKTGDVDALPHLKGRFRKCTKCGGVADVHEARWYEQGLAHARKQP